MTIFELVFGLWSFSCASIGLEFKIQTLCTWSCQCTHQEKDWGTKWFVPWFICVISNWLVLVWIWIRRISVELTQIQLFGIEKRVCLCLWHVGGECDMEGNDEDWGSSRRLGVEDQGWSGTSRVLGGRTIKRSGDAVCDLHRTHGGDEKRGLSSLASKPTAMVCQWFGLKTNATVTCFGPQNHHDGFLVCALKPSGRRFVGLPLKTDE
jgi:hypothetical protein